MKVQGMKTPKLITNRATYGKEKWSTLSVQKLLSAASREAMIPCKLYGTIASLLGTVGSFGTSR